MTKLQLLATLLAWAILVLLGSCSSDDYSEPDVLKVTPDLRARINTGIKMVSRAEKADFNEKFVLFLNKCEEMGGENTPYQYMETDAYKKLRAYMLSASPLTSYLLMDRYLKRVPTFSALILNDLIETAYPDTADDISKRMISSTVQESLDLYPQVCLEAWLDAIENR